MMINRRGTRLKFAHNQSWYHHWDTYSHNYHAVSQVRIFRILYLESQEGIQKHDDDTVSNNQT